MNRTHLARHKLIDFYGCNPNLISFAKFVEQVLLEASQIAGCNIVGSKSHQFNPVGATAFVMVAESHFSIHTWPEHGKALVDVFASGNMDLDAAIRHIEDRIGATSKRIIDVERG